MSATSDGPGQAEAHREQARLPPGVTLRAMRVTDIEAGLRLCRLSHWNQEADDWAQFLRLQPDGAVVAERDGAVIGSVATLRLGHALAWVAMVLVDPAARGQGIGMALLHRGLELVQDVPLVGLDATPAGQRLYVKLGFRSQCALTRLERPALPNRTAPDRPPTGPVPADVALRPLASGDWDWVSALDHQTCGYLRLPMLQWLATRAPRYAWVEQSGDGIGFALGRPGHRFEHVGPVVATSPTVARRLVARCLAEVGTRPVIIDAPDAQPGWHAWLHTVGFTTQRPFSRMYRGVPTVPACGHDLFASIGAEFG
jgi:GNAT superfamily N-acetyltransferase